MMSRHFLGLAIGYGWIVASTFLGASGFGIFISFAVELIVLLLIYTVYRTIDQRRNPRKYAKHQWVGQIWIAALPVIAIHFIAIRFVVGQSDLNEDLPVITFLLYEWQTWLALILILVFYLLSYSKNTISEVVDHSRNKFLVGMILFTVIPLVGILVFNVIEHPQFIILISVMAGVRLLLEVLLTKKFKLVQ